MDPHSFIARAEAQRWLGIAEKLLMGHDLVGSKTFAIRARESDPRLEAADQILAIADTLLAAEKRVAGSHGTQQPDYYAILQLVRFVQDTEHIADQYRRLAVTLNPHQNRFPYSDQAFQLVNDAWAVLSNPLRKSMYDSELDFPQQQEMNHIGFNLEHHHHQQQQQQHQQQHQHNFFSINRMGSGNEQELVEQQRTFLQTRVQRSHQQHNFMSQSNPVRPSPVREQEQLFQQREEEELFQPQVQPFQITSTPQQQLRPPSQPPQPQLPTRASTPPPPPTASAQPPVSWPQPPPHSQPQPPMQSTTPSPPPPPAASPQPTVSWPQPPPHSQPQPPMQSTPSPPPPPPPAESPHPPMPWPQPVPHSQPQPHIRSRSPPPPPPEAPLQPPVSWPQPPPHSQTPLQTQPQSQPQQEQHHQQQDSLEQNATPVQPPTHSDTNNSVSEEEKETVTESDSENIDSSSPTFWTACPYCLYMYEYPRVYAECTLRCRNCERAFQAVPVPSPPPIIEGQEAYFCCWGSFPLGISISNLENNNGKGTNKYWTSISPLYDVSPQVHHNLNDSSPKKRRNSEPRIYIDDVTDDIFTGISEPSDDSDLDWKGTDNKKVKKMKKRGRKRKAKGVHVKKTRKRRKKILQNSVESSKKEVVSNSNPRRQSGRVAKEMGKLDLNVEFNNNEGEESGSKMIGGNRGQGQGEEDNIEGNGFFEGLDEFLSSLPILSVVNEEKDKAS